MGSGNGSLLETSRNFWRDSKGKQGWDTENFECQRVLIAKCLSLEIECLIL
jgi:hypothetical protein